MGGLAQRRGWARRHAGPAAGRAGRPAPTPLPTARPVPISVPFCPPFSSAGLCSNVTTRTCHSLSPPLSPLRACPKSDFLAFVWLLPLFPTRLQTPAGRDGACLADWGIPVLVTVPSHRRQPESSDSCFANECHGTRPQPTPGSPGLLRTCSPSSSESVSYCVVTCDVKVTHG